MATIRQKKLARGIVEAMKMSEPPTKKDLLIQAGYSVGTGIASAERQMQGDGVIEELEKLGFSEQKAKEVVGRILTDEAVKPKDRLTAADMTFKVHGTYAPEKNLNVNVMIDPEKREALSEIAHDFRDKIRRRIAS